MDDEGFIFYKGRIKRMIISNGYNIYPLELDLGVIDYIGVFDNNGKEYPAYCLNRDLHGVGDYIESYDVTNQGRGQDADVQNRVCKYLKPFDLLIGYTIPRIAGR